MSQIYEICFLWVHLCRLKYSKGIDIQLHETIKTYQKMEQIESHWRNIWQRWCKDVLKGGTSKYTRLKCAYVSTNNIFALEFDCSPYSVSITLVFRYVFLPLSIHLFRIFISAKIHAQEANFLYLGYAYSLPQQNFTAVSGDNLALS